MENTGSNADGMKPLAVIILNWNGRDLLRRFLPSVVEHSDSSISRIVVAPLLIHYPFWGLPVHGIGIFILYIALILTIVSGVNYFYRFYCDWSSSRLDTAHAGDGAKASNPQQPSQDAS